MSRYTSAPLNYYFPPAVRTIFFLCLLVFILVHALPVHQATTLFEALALDTQHFPSLELWRVVTYGFVHVDFSHFFWNMFALVMFGAVVEHALGSRSTWTIFLLSTIGGGLGQGLLTLLLKSGGSYVIGASGGIAGLIGAFTLIAPPDSTIYISFIIPVKTRYFGLIYLALQILFAFSGGGHTAYGAHIFGFLTGYFLTLKGGHNLGEQVYQKVSRRKTKKKKKTHLKAVPNRVHKPTNPKKEEAQQKLDRLLDKINLMGIDSLTSEERASLEYNTKLLKEDE